MNMKLMVVTSLAVLLGIGGANSVSGQPIFWDDFEAGNLGKWTIGGRQLGTNIANVVVRHGSNMAHVYHRDFTEITIQNIFPYDPDLTFSFDMESTVRSNASSTSDFYSAAMVEFTFWETEVPEQGAPYGNVKYAKTTSSFPLTRDNVPGTNVYWHRITDSGLQSYSLKASDMLNDIEVTFPVNYVRFRFRSYASGWPYNMAAEVWVDNVNVTTRQVAVPEPATTLLVVCGLAAALHRRRRHP